MKLTIKIIEWIHRFQRRCTGFYHRSLRRHRLVFVEIVHILQLHGIVADPLKLIFLRCQLFGTTQVDQELFVRFLPFRTCNFPQLSSLVDFIVTNLLVFEPNDNLSEGFRVLDVGRLGIWIIEADKLVLQHFSEMMKLIITKTDSAGNVYLKSTELNAQRTDKLKQNVANIKTSTRGLSSLTTKILNISN